jgi:uncharacterized membrane protein
VTALRILPWALLVALFAFALGTFSGLPAEIPTHINAAGEPTNLVPKSLGNWMLLPLVALAVQGLMAGLSAYLPKRPDLFNFPEKARLLALPPSYQAPAVAWMRVVLDVSALITLLIMAYVQWMLWRTALGHRESAGLAIILVGTALMLPAILILVSKVNEATIEAERKWKEAGSPTA